MPKPLFLPAATSGPASPAKPFRAVQWIFLSNMVALDFAFGWVAKPLVQAIGLGGALKLEMVPPMMILLLTRLTLDRFGVLAAYELAWGLACTVVLPGAILPGPLKLAPLLLQGLCLDAAFSAFKPWPRARVYLAAVAGGMAGALVLGGSRLLLGLPWGRATRIYIGWQLLAGAAVHAVAAWLALAVWARVKDQAPLRRIRT